MHQSLYQAVPIGAPSKISELMQLPNMSYARSMTLIKALPHLVGRHGIQGLWNADDEERRKALGVGETGMKEQEYKEMLRIAGEWPRLELKDAFFKGECFRALLVGRRRFFKQSIIIR